MKDIFIISNIVIKPIILPKYVFMSMLNLINRSPYYNSLNLSDLRRQLILFCMSNVHNTSVRGFIFKSSSLQLNKENLG